MKFKLTDWRRETRSLNIFYQQFEEREERWILIQRNKLTLLSERFIPLSLLASVKSGLYFFRIFDKTVERGAFTSMSQLYKLTRSYFQDVAVCIENVEKLRFVRNDDEMEEVLSNGCPIYFKTTEEEEIAQGKGHCTHCKTKLKLNCSDEIIQEDKVLDKSVMDEFLFSPSKAVTPPSTQAPSEPDNDALAPSEPDNNALAPSEPDNDALAPSEHDNDALKFDLSEIARRAVYVCLRRLTSHQTDDRTANDDRKVNDDNKVDDDRKNNGDIDSNGDDVFDCLKNSDSRRNPNNVESDENTELNSDEDDVYDVGMFISSDLSNDLNIDDKDDELDTDTGENKQIVINPFDKVLQNEEEEQKEGDIDEEQDDIFGQAQDKVLKIDDDEEFEDLYEEVEPFGNHQHSEEIESGEDNASENTLEENKSGDFTGVLKFINDNYDDKERNGEEGSDDEDAGNHLGGKISLSKRESQDRHSGLVGYHSGLGEDHRGLEDERGNETSDIEGESDLEEEEKAERNVEEELILNSKRSIQNPKENKGGTEESDGKKSGFTSDAEEDIKTEKSENVDLLFKFPRTPFQETSEQTRNHQKTFEQVSGNDNDENEDKDNILKSELKSEGSPLDPSGAPGPLNPPLVTATRSTVVYVGHLGTHQDNDPGITLELQAQSDGEDMKIIPARSNPLVPMKKKRGRPRKIIPEETLRKRKRLSESTKQKISENNKKFSICKLCGNQCRGFRGLVDHMYRDHPTHKPWSCHLCPIKTAFVKTLYRHLKVEHKVMESPCPKCGKKYTRAQSMLAHVTKHEADPGLTYSCKVCRAVFQTKDKLEQHVGKRHCAGFECEQCNKKFSELSSLKEHRRTHTRERPYQCTECGSTFSFHSTFTTHSKIHLREQGVTEDEAKVRLYHDCDICGKTYVNSSGLRIHKRHVHEKFSENVPCDVCGRAFRTRELLKQHHERNHTDSPKFACDFCGQRFGRKYHLKRHRAVHTEDGFPCDKCSRIFKREDGLKLHMKAHRSRANADPPSQDPESSFIKVQEDFPLEKMEIDENSDPAPSPTIVLSPEPPATFKDPPFKLHHPVPRYPMAGLPLYPAMEDKPNLHLYHEDKYSPNYPILEEKASLPIHPAMEAKSSLPAVEDKSIHPYFSNMEDKSSLPFLPTAGEDKPSLPLYPAGEHKAGLPNYSTMEDNLPGNKAEEVDEEQDEPSDDCLETQEKEPGPPVTPVVEAKLKTFELEPSDSVSQPLVMKETKKFETLSKTKKVENLSPMHALQKSFGPNTDLIDPSPPQIHRTKHKTTSSKSNEVTSGWPCVPNGSVVNTTAGLIQKSRVALDVAPKASWQDSAPNYHPQYPHNLPPNNVNPMCAVPPDYNYQAPPMYVQKPSIGYNMGYNLPNTTFAFPPAFRPNRQEYVGDSYPANMAAADSPPSQPHRPFSAQASHSPTSNQPSPGGVSSLPNLPRSQPSEPNLPRSKSSVSNITRSQYASGDLTPSYEYNVPPTPNSLPSTITNSPVVNPCGNSATAVGPRNSVHPSSNAGGVHFPQAGPSHYYPPFPKSGFLAPQPPPPHSANLPPRSGTSLRSPGAPMSSPMVSPGFSAPTPGSTRRHSSGSSVSPMRSPEDPSSRVPRQPRSPIASGSGLNQQTQGAQRAMDSQRSHTHAVQQAHAPYGERAQSRDVQQALEDQRAIDLCSLTTAEINQVLSLPLPPFQDQVPATPILEPHMHTPINRNHIQLTISGTGAAAQQEGPQPPPRRSVIMMSRKQ